ncbi:MAG: hypothetical protein IPP96_09440 [Chitinophagaceae bacterium]|nr:hypothetical protein [Chitinophagaceae bacterium]
MCKFTGKNEMASITYSINFTKGSAFKLLSFQVGDNVYFSGTIISINVTLKSKISTPWEVDIVLNNISFEKSTTKPKEGCFIATAVYENYNAPEVILLREFRDNTLLSSLGGRTIVNLYYRISPFIASIISKSQWLKKLPKNCCLP